MMYVAQHRCSLPFQSRTRISAIPERGYFSIVDPTAEVKFRKRPQFEVTKRRGKSDFIWNVDWSAHFEGEKRLKQEAAERKQKLEEKPSGFLSLTRAADLNDVSKDFSQKLKPRLNPPSTAKDSSTKPSSDYLPPTQNEAVNWARSAKFSRRVVALDMDTEQRQQALADMETYHEENREILVWNASLGCLCFIATYFAYNQDVAMSYLVGAIGGVMYLRLLKKGVEGIGVGGISSLAAQPRLLIPVVLVMTFNRWNTLAADDVGIHLQLMPMFIGFLTYKAAVVSRQTLQLLRDVVVDIKRESRK